MLAGIILILLALYLAIYWKQLIITLPVGNKENLNFLWILRDYTPEFICRILNFVCNVKLFFRSSFLYYGYLNELEPLHNINYYFSSYLAGLIEGDGSIIVPKTERSLKGKLNYPSIQITFNLRDFPLAQMIQLRLKHGSLTRKKGVNAYVLTVNNFEGVILITHLINGYMRTPKINSLFNLIN